MVTAAFCSFEWLWAVVLSKRGKTCSINVIDATILVPRTNSKNTANVHAIHCELSN